MKRVLATLLLVGVGSACPPPRLEAPPPAKGAVQFTLVSEPAGADVTIDGVPRGATPLTTQLTPGTHRVVMAKSGYFALETAVEVTAGGSFTGTLVASH